MSAVSCIMSAIQICNYFIVFVSIACFALYLFLKLVYSLVAMLGMQRALPLSQDQRLAARDTNEDLQLPAKPTAANKSMETPRKDDRTSRPS